MPNASRLKSVALISLAALLEVDRATAQAAATERATATLDYAASAPNCPDEQAFRDIVAGRLGHDPFVPEAPWKVRARLEPRGRRLHGTLEVQDGAGAIVGAREISGSRSECGEIAGALAVAISVALDPLGKPTTAVPPTPPVVATSAVPAAPVPPPAASTLTGEATSPLSRPAPPPPRTKPVDFTADAGLAVGFGLAPAATLGPVVAVGLRRASFSVHLDGRADPSLGTARGTTRDRLEATLFTAGPAGCVHFEPGLACLALELGAFQGRAIDVEDSRTRTSFFSAAAARIGIGHPLGRVLALRALGELRVPFVRTSLSVDDTTVWNAPALGAGLRLQLSATF